MSAARQDFATIEQSVRQRTSQIVHHHRHFSEGSSISISQNFNTLAQDLQSGNVSAAQSAFSGLQQALDPSAASLVPSAAAAGSQPSSNAINFLI